MKTDQIKGTFVLNFALPKQVGTQSREDFLGRFSDHCSSLNDFLGVVEGELLAEDAHERGYETESWVLDAGMAPHERDWLSQESTLFLKAYFSSQGSAIKAETWLSKELKTVTKIEFEPDQDWNAKWKASFQGIEVSSDFRVLPPWHEDWVQGKRTGILGINPGAGFGTGTHETTRLCLQSLRKLKNLSGMTVLDFGSGSGILGIAAAQMGADVYCVEVDPMANDNAAENAKLNQVESRVHISTQIPDQLHQKVDILLANILRPILLQFAPQILECLKPHCELILSGLIETDLTEVIERYQGSFSTHEVFAMGEWRAIHLKRMG